MNRNKRYHNNFHNQVLLSLVVIFLLFTCFLGFCEFKKFDIPSRTDQTQSFKTASALPLSALNFYKTRPKGLTTQEPVYKFAVLTISFYLHQPGQFEIIYRLQTGVCSHNPGNAGKIRPPPIA